MQVHIGLWIKTASGDLTEGKSLHVQTPEEALAQALSSVGLQASPIANRKLQHGAPASAIERQIKNAGGAMDATGAFVTSATLLELQEIQDQLKDQSYYVQSLRISHQGDDLRFTACWRTQKATRLELELSKSELVSVIQSMTLEGYRAIDIGGYCSERFEDTDAKYWVIWESASEANQKQIVRIALDNDERVKIFTELRGDHHPIARQAFFDSQDQIRFCEIWEPTDKDNSPLWAIFTQPPERMPEQFFAFKHIQCQSVDMAQSKISLDKMMSVEWRNVAETSDFKVLHSLPQEILISAGRELLAQGFEPISMCVSDGASGNQHCAAVWRRQKH